MNPPPFPFTNASAAGKSSSSSSAASTAGLQIHQTLGPLFAAHVAAWPAHYQTLADFWTVQTGNPRDAYRGRLLAAHAPLDLRPTHLSSILARLSLSGQM